MVDLLLNARANINQSSETGNTALMYAAEYNHIEIVKLLLEVGVNINQQSKIGTQLVAINLIFLYIYY